MWFPSIFLTGLNYKNFTDLPPSIDIACHNSEGNVTLSGPIKDMKNYIDILKKRNIFVREVNSNGIAYHSRMVHQQAEFVKKFIEKVILLIKDVIASNNCVLFYFLGCTQS